MQPVKWQLIVRKHSRVVWDTAYRLLGNEAEAADCVQEVFIKALELSRRERVRNFGPLLRKVVNDNAIDRLRKRLRKHESSVDLATLPVGNPGPAEQAQGSELANHLRKALTQLPQQEAQVFCLRCFNEMSYRQIGRELGIKTNAVGVSLKRARTKLGVMLEAFA